MGNLTGVAWLLATAFLRASRATLRGVGALRRAHFARLGRHLSFTSVHDNQPLLESRQNSHPGGGGPQLTSGTQPRGGTQPSGATGQFGGEVNRNRWRRRRRIREPRRPRRIVRAEHITNTAKAISLNVPSLSACPGLGSLGAPPNTSATTAVAPRRIISRLVDTRAIRLSSGHGGTGALLSITHSTSLTGTGSWCSRHH